MSLWKLKSSRHTTAFAPGHALFAIGKRWLPTVAVALVNTLSPCRAAPQAPSHAVQKRHA